MPIKEGSRLWFNTKEEQQEFDDKMIASIVIQSKEFEDPNFSPIFFRKREEKYLTVAKKAGNSSVNLDSINHHLSGKRDHTFWRDIIVYKYGLYYTVGYLLLRELPIRNFYARAWIMVLAFSSLSNVWRGLMGKGGLEIVDDPFNHKDIKNYGVYNDLMMRKPPGLENKLPENKLWKLNQPGHMEVAPERYINSAATSFVTRFQAPQVVPWDGTFNMPLASLANPKHKDAKFTDFHYM